MSTIQKTSLLYKTFALAVGLTLILNQTASVAAAPQAILTSFTGMLLNDGTPVFDALDPGATNGLIRTHDYAEYRYQYITDPTGAGNDAQITLTLLVGAMPPSYIGPALSATMVWDLLPAVCLPGSNISADGLTLTCKLGDITTAQVQTIDFRARVLGVAPNGATVSAPTALFSASDTPATPATGAIPMLTVVAKPRWDVEKSRYWNPVFTSRFMAGSGPLGEDGVVTGYDIAVFASGSRKGTEALANDQITLTDDVSGMPADTLLLTWPITGTPVNEPTGCKSTDPSDHPVSNSYEHVRDTGPAASTQVFSVANGGLCSASQPGGAGTPITISITGIDSSLEHYPTFADHAGIPGAPIINPVNPDDATNRYYIVHKTLYLWTPIGSFATGSNSVTNRVKSSAVSVTNQNNADPGNTTPPGGNNRTNRSFTVGPALSGRKYFSSWRQGIAGGGKYVPCDPNILNNCVVDYVEATQRYVTGFQVANLGTTTLTNVVACEKIDNTRQTIVAWDASTPTIKDSFLHSSGIGIAYAPDNMGSPGQPAPAGVIVEFGTGGSGGIGQTWSSYYTTASPYKSPSTGNSSTHSSGGCADSDSPVWYTALAPAPGGVNPQLVTKVRIKIPTMPAGTSYMFSVGLEARSAYAYDSKDCSLANVCSPGAPFNAGDSTLDAMVPNQYGYSSTEFPPSTGRRSADALKITPVTFVKVAKSSPSHPVPGELVSPGETITYELIPNFTSPALTRPPMDVTVTDVLPPTVNFLPGSVTIGGSPAPDPAITSDSPATGYTTLTFTLHNQTPALALPGETAGNLSPIRYKVKVELLAPDASRILNSSIADSATNAYPKCVFDFGLNLSDSSDDVGFRTIKLTDVPPPADPDLITVGAKCQYGNWGPLEVDNPPGFKVYKDTSSPFVDVNQKLYFGLHYASVGTPVNDLEIVDILPYNGDNRVPPTDYVGVLVLESVTPPVGLAAPILYYTKNAPGNINPNPKDASNNPPDGSGTNGPTQTVWCLESQFGSGDCPANIGESTAFRFNPNEVTVPGTEFTLDVVLNATNNKPASSYTNNFSSASPDLPVVLVSDDINVTAAASGISGTIYVDSDNDGVMDTGETGIANVPIMIECTAAPNCVPGTQYSTLTHADGTYSFNPSEPDIHEGPDPTADAPIANFDGVYSGTWKVVEITQPVGYSDGIDSPGNMGGTASPSPGDEITDIILPVAVSGTGYNFGEVPAHIGHHVWLDVDGDGIRDPSENGLANVTVRLLDSSGNPLKDTVTDSNGFYSLSDLAEGDYIVQFVAPTGYLISPKDQGTDDTIDSDANPLDGKTDVIHVTAGDDDHNTDVGMSQPAQIGDYIWADVNANGIQDAGEIGLAGVTVNLLDSSNAVIATTTTDAGGLYSLMNVHAGQYKVQFIAPFGYSLTLANQGLDDTKDSDADPVTGQTALFDILSNEIVTKVDAGMFKPAQVGDRVWEDLNGNGIQDAGEAGISGATVNLLDSSSAVVATTTSDASGLYAFNAVAPGTYSIQFVLPASFNFSPKDQGADDTKDTDADPATGVTAPFVLASGQGNLDLDVGMYQDSALGDGVWDDLNANGIQDAGENGIAGVTVNLLDAFGHPFPTPITTTTDVSGNYSFPALAPGDYIVQFVLPAGYTFSPANQGTDDLADSDADTVTGKSSVITMVSNIGNVSVDAGMFKAAQVGDFVWEDMNGDGIQDAGEDGVAGVTVNLYNALGGLVSSTMTDAAGNYNFVNIAPGDYYLVFTPPSADWHFTLANQGSDDTIDSDPNSGTGQTAVFTLGSNQNNNDLDAGLFQYVTIGNRVWEDLNSDGIQDAGEPGKENVTVKLLDENGNTVATTTTDASGAYVFDNVVPGNYIIQVVPPIGYALTHQDQGGDDAKDSDPNIGTGKTPVIVFTSGQEDQSIDAGLIQESSLLSKDFTGTNAAHTTDPEVTIGEIITYRVTATVRFGMTYPNMTMTDVLDRGLVFVSCVSVTASSNNVTTTAPGGFAGVCSSPVVSTEPLASPNPADPGRKVVFNFGDVTNTGASDETITVTYRVVVLNNVENAQGVTPDLNNSVAWNWDGGSLAAQATPVRIVEPKLSIQKTANVTIVYLGDTITYQVVIKHTADSKADAFDVLVEDILPSYLLYVNASLISVSGQAPTSLTYDAVTSTIHAHWDAFLNNGQDAVIQYKATVVDLSPTGKIENTARVEWTSLPGDPGVQSQYNPHSTERAYDPANPADIYQSTSTVIINDPPIESDPDDPDLTGTTLPKTGFAPNVVTIVPAQPAEKAYTNEGLWLEIPALKLRQHIVGVPLLNKGWDVSWLGDSIGWLNGTAFPTWDGNSTLTGHVVNADGLPGPFQNLGNMKWGDKIIVHAWGQQYVFEVREVNKKVDPKDNSLIVKHEEKPWLTLITCNSYDEKTKTYRYRVAVRAVLISVVSDK